MKDLRFLSPDRQESPQVEPSCPLRLARAAYAARPKILSLAIYFEGGSSDDDLPNVIDACTSVEMLSRNGQPLLPGNTAEAELVDGPALSYRVRGGTGAIFR